jgi:hypothetical protein
MFILVLLRQIDYLDGSSVTNIDVAGAVEKCRTMVSSDEDITVDIILTHPAEIEVINSSTYNTWSMLFRTVSYSNP